MCDFNNTFHACAALVVTNHYSAGVLHKWTCSLNLFNIFKTNEFKTVLHFKQQRRVVIL